jgi:hypothetical protein
LCYVCSQNGDHGQSELAPTNAPTSMDGALMSFSFLSMCFWAWIGELV